MTTVKIRLTTIADIRDFVNLVTACENEVDLASGRYVVDAKSIMGIFSLDLMQPLTMTVHSDDCGDFLQKISRFIVE